MHRQPTRSSRGSRSYGPSSNLATPQSRTNAGRPPHPTEMTPSSPCGWRVRSGWAARSWHVQTERLLDRTERPRDTAPVTTAWVGALVFAGLMLFLLGVFHVIQGIVALADHTFYIARKGHLVVAGDYTAWGWLHLVLGVVALAAGTGIFVGALWARVAGAVVAVVSALSSML